MLVKISVNTFTVKQLTQTDVFTTGRKKIRHHQLFNHSVVNNSKNRNQKSIITIRSNQQNTTEQPKQHQQIKL